MKFELPKFLGGGSKKESLPDLGHRLQVVRNNISDQVIVKGTNFLVEVGKGNGSKVLEDLPKFIGPHADLSDEYIYEAMSRMTSDNYYQEDSC